MKGDGAGGEEESVSTPLLLTNGMEFGEVASRGDGAGGKGTFGAGTGAVGSKEDVAVPELLRFPLLVLGAVDVFQDVSLGGKVGCLTVEA